MKRLRLPSVLLLSTVTVCSLQAKEPLPSSPSPRLPTQDVNSPALRAMPGLRPGENLLFNGWGISPAGHHIPVSDLALRLVVAPDQLRLIAVHGGFNEHGVTLIDPVKGEQTQFLPLRKSWNGLAFSHDGKHFFVSGGDSGQIHAFTYSSGTASLEREVKPAPEEEPVFLAGLAIRPSSGRIYACNEANHEVWVINPETLLLEGRIPVGQHPHSCVLGADRRHLYVSNWGSQSISVVDTEKGRQVREIEVGVRPNE
ncbi:MAG TPA: SMP-30/gluconolactonase/LRE family protein, partial [Verrucomicrobiae bacterium]|nr:SMP-30/gluconolactonase/LRE family protein [Verrucomicrobiae bacterium]